MARLIEKDFLDVNEGELVLLETKTETFVGTYQMYGDGVKYLGISFEGLGLSDDFDLSEYGVTWRIWDLLGSLPTTAELDMMEPWEEGEDWHGTQLRWL